mmetsp:Transcript_53521/g.64456  ORF Transcript_53521/g.64456 Transcript_53521/m.64456 type:complete len:133 (+) Transcript_53521:325-723(+)
MISRSCHNLVLKILPKRGEINPAKISATCFVNYSSPRYHKSLNDLSEDDGKVQKNLLHRNSRGCIKEPYVKYMNSSSGGNMFLSCLPISGFDTPTYVHIYTKGFVLVLQNHEMWCFTGKFCAASYNLFFMNS